MPRKDPMFAGANNRSMSMALVVMMAVIAIAIPTCTMIGCDMSMGQGMPFMPSGTGIYNECSGEWFTSTGPAGIVSNGVESLLLSLVVAAFVAAVVFAPRNVVAVVESLPYGAPTPTRRPLGAKNPHLIDPS